MFRLVARLLFLSFCFIVTTRLSGQFSYDKVVYPDCESIKNTSFDSNEILANENRFLFEGSLEKIEELYCYAKRTTNLELEAVSLILLARVYMNSYLVPNSLEYGLTFVNRSIEISEENGFINTLLSAKEVQCTNLNSYAMYDEANVCCNEFMEIARLSEDSVRIAEGYMLLGRVYKDRKKFSKADSVLRKSQTFLKDNPASNRIGVYTFVHLSGLYSDLKEYDKALDFARKGLKLSEGTTDQKEFMQALLAQQIIKCQLEIGNFDTEEMFDLAKDEISGNTWFRGYYYDIKGRYFNKIGQTDSAQVYFNKALEFYKDKGVNQGIIQASFDWIELLKEKGELNPVAYKAFRSLRDAGTRINQDSKRLSSYERIYYELEEEKDKSELLQKRARNYAQMLWLTVGAIILLLFIGLMIYGQLSLKKRHNRKLKGLNEELNLKNVAIKESMDIIEVENEKVRSELKNQLTIVSGYGAQLEKMERRLLANNNLDAGFKDKMLNALDAGRNKHVIEDINLKSFDVNQELIAKLSHQYPALTQNDLKLCLHLKMNLSTKEIARLESKSAQSIKVARSRLRKKLSIPDSAIKLSTFINEL